MQQPTISREVHFVLKNGQHRSAKVVNVFGDNRPNLHVALDYTNDSLPLLDFGLFHLVPAQSVPFTTPHQGGFLLQVDSVPHDEGTKAPGTWHYPERV